jgi:methionyl-tRNA formyltransferase
MGMRILFIGTAELAAPLLRAVARTPNALVGVVTQPERPQGRHRLLRPSPVKRAADELGLPVYEPVRIGADSSLNNLRALDPDIILVAAYGQILPAAVLDLPRLGCFNVHASLLPALRGPAPVNWAIIRGLDVTGVTLFRMDAGVDTGDFVAQRATPIGPRETAPELSRRLSQLAVELLIECLPGIEVGAVSFTAQDDGAATLAPKLTKADGAIDWTRPAGQIDRLIRGVTPWPGAFALFQHAKVPDHTIRLAVHSARPVEAGEAAPAAAAPGTVVGVAAGTVLVAAGAGLLALETVQPAGKRKMTAADFVHGYRVAAGDGFLPAAAALNPSTAGAS